MTVNVALCVSDNEEKLQRGVALCDSFWYYYFRIDRFLVFFLTFFCLEIRLRISHKVFSFLRLSPGTEFQAIKETFYGFMNPHVV